MRFTGHAGLVSASTGSMPRLRRARNVPHPTKQRLSLAQQNSGFVSPNAVTVLFDRLFMFCSSGVAQRQLSLQ